MARSPPVAAPAPKDDSVAAKLKKAFARVAEDPPQQPSKPQALARSRSVDPVEREAAEMAAEVMRMADRHNHNGKLSVRC